MVMSAFTNYRQGNYDEAINAGKRYVTLYPSSEDAAYAQYIVGLCYFRQIRDVTQDQKESRRAIEAMEEVIQRWPESQYVEDARTKVRFARDQLAGKEMQVGRYYLERREYIAAAKRFRYVVENYSNTRHVEEALARLTETYYAMGLTSEAQTAAAVLGHNYPDSQWYKDSYALLQTGGLEPRENAGSWISRAGQLFGGDDLDSLTSGVWNRHDPEKWEAVFGEDHARKIHLNAVPPVDPRYRPDRAAGHRFFARPLRPHRRDGRRQIHPA